MHDKLVVFSFVLIEAYDRQHTFSRAVSIGSQFPHEHLQRIKTSHQSSPEAELLVVPEHFVWEVDSPAMINLFSNSLLHQAVDWLQTMRHEIIKYMYFEVFEPPLQTMW